MKILDKDFKNGFVSAFHCAVKVVRMIRVVSIGKEY